MTCLNGVQHCAPPLPQPAAKHENTEKKQAIFRKYPHSRKKRKKSIDHGPDYGTIWRVIFHGDVAQLEEHHNGIVGVVSSNLIVSIFLYSLVV